MGGSDAERAEKLGEFVTKYLYNPGASDAPEVMSELLRSDLRNQGKEEEAKEALAQLLGHVLLNMGRTSNGAAPSEADFAIFQENVGKLQKVLHA